MTDALHRWDLGAFMRVEIREDEAQPPRLFLAVSHPRDLSLDEAQRLTACLSQAIKITEAIELERVVKRTEGAA